MDAYRTTLPLPQAAIVHAVQTYFDTIATAGRFQVIDVVLDLGTGEYHVEIVARPTDLPVRNRLQAEIDHDMAVAQAISSGAVALFQGIAAKMTKLARLDRPLLIVRSPDDAMPPSLPTRVEGRP